MQLCWGRSMISAISHAQYLNSVTWVQMSGTLNMGAEAAKSEVCPQTIRALHMAAKHLQCRQ